MPRINTTPTVKIALWALRIYLLVLLALIGIKFVRVFSAQKANDSAPAVSAATNGATNQPSPQAKP